MRRRARKARPGARRISMALPANRRNENQGQQRWVEDDHLTELDRMIHIYETEESEGWSDAGTGTMCAWHEDGRMFGSCCSVLAGHFSAGAPDRYRQAVTGILEAEVAFFIAQHD